VFGKDALLFFFHRVLPRSFFEGWHFPDRTERIFLVFPLCSRISLLSLRESHVPGAFTHVTGVEEYITDTLVFKRADSVCRKGICGEEASVCVVVVMVESMRVDFYGGTWCPEGFCCAA
jgi:hypothetical protein